MSPGPRCGFVALLGAPNAGKSTLVNRLVGSKVAIVTHKAQTTRSALRGIVIEGESQIVVVDTPGIFTPRRRLDRAMVDAAWRGVEDADLVIVLIDAARLVRHATGPLDDPDIAPVLQGLAERPVPAFLVLNKIDLMERPALLALAQALTGSGRFEAVFMISAETGDGVADLRQAIARRMPEGPWHYPADQAADVPLRFLASEVTREQLTLKLHDELPYASTVETERWEERPDGSVRIEQIVYVERAGQKAIVLGRGGATIKAIGAAARRSLEAMLERRVHLFLIVKVRERWSEEPERLARLGLDLPKG